MSKNNESFMSNNESKSSKIFKFSKNGLDCASAKSNFVTLKDGNQELTLRLNNNSLNKNIINQAISNIKNEMLINSQSYTRIYEKDNLQTFLKKKNLLKLSSQRKTPKLKKNETINFETSRNLIKTTENNKNNIEKDDNNIIEKSVKNNNLYKALKLINKKNIEKNNDIKNNITNDIEVIDIVENNTQKNNIIDKKHFISKDYYNNINKNQNKNKKENIEKYKSEEIKEMNSTTSKDIDNKLVKNNFIEKNNKRSDKATKKSISDLDADKKTKIVIKLIIEKNTSNKEDNKNKEPDNFERLITEKENLNNEEYLKDLEKDKIDILSENKSSKSIEVKEEEEEECDESDEENETVKKDNNNVIDNNKDSNNKITSIILIKKKEENKDEEKKKDIKKNDQNTLLKIKEEFSDKNGIQKIKKLKPIKSLKETKNNNNKDNENDNDNENDIYHLCKICDHAFPKKRLFVAECKKHFLCRRCAKNYYEDIIENGIREMCCPFIQCKKPFNLENVKKLISKSHLNCLYIDKNNIDEKQNMLFMAKIKTNVKKDNLELYTKKNVFEINSNRNFYNYNNIKETYCPNCFKESLFSKTNTHFFKCLNCGCKRCKYCMKEFNPGHMNVNSENYCKVYHRYDEYISKNSNVFFNFFIQLLFIVASYYMCFGSTFIYIRNIFLSLFRANNNGNVFLCILAYLFTIIIFIIVFPFIEIFYPFFPNIMALSDY